jgi:cytochrome P450
VSELYDPYSHELHKDPYSVYRTLRDEHPLYRSESRNCWVLSRFEDVIDAALNWQRFISGQGVLLDRGDLTGDAGGLPMLVMLDPPRHTTLRRIVSRAFTPRRVAEMEPRIRRTARDLLDSVAAAGGEGDFVHDVAGPLPSTVIADMMGVPKTDQDAFREWSDSIMRGDPSDEESTEASLFAIGSLLEYFDGIIEDRRQTPGDDLVTALVHTDLEPGEELTTDELLWFCVLLLVAGNETTTNLISNGMVTLARHPEQRAALAAAPGRIGNAVEEILRYESPVQVLARTVAEATEIHGTKLEPGEKVLLNWGSANRDEREFDAPEVFDVERKIVRHAAFGHGIHFCLGASLARLEGRVTFEELLVRFPTYELTAEPELLHSGIIRGFDSIPFSVGDRALSARSEAGLAGRT